MNGYVRHRIQHTQKVYVMGDIHTNTIEGFWSWLSVESAERITA